MMAGATHVHSHDDDDRAPRHAARRRGRRPRPRRRRRPGDATTHDHGHGDRRPRGDGRRGLAAAVGPGRADRLLRRPRRHGRAAGPRRGARRIDDRRAPAVRRRDDARRALGFQSIGDAGTGFEHYINPRVHRRRPLPRPDPAGVARVRGRRRPADAGLGDVHRQGPRHRRPRARRLGRAADAVARPREPVLGLDEDGQPKVVGLTDDAGELPARLGQRRRRDPDGPRLDRPPRVRAVRRPRGPRRRTGRRRPAPAPTSAPTTTTRRPADAAGDRRLRPDEADRPLRRRGRDAGAAGLRREPRRRHARRACRSGPTRPSPRRPASTRSATPAPVTSTTSSGTGSTTTCGSTPTRRRASCTSRSPTARKKLVSAMYMLPTSVALDGRARPRRAADAVAHPRQPLLHRRSRRPAGRVASPRPTARAAPPLVKHDEAPMIHVWITPHECGPFAALEGVGAGADRRGRGALVRPRPRLVNRRCDRACRDAGTMETCPRVVVTGLVVAVAAVVTVALARRGRRRRPGGSDEAPLDPADVADLTARFAGIDAEQAATAARPARVPPAAARPPAGAGALHRGAYRSCARTGSASPTARPSCVRGEVAGDAGVLAVGRAPARRAPGRLPHRRRRHAPRVRLVRRPAAHVAARHRARPARLSLGRSVSGARIVAAASSSRMVQERPASAAIRARPAASGERPVVPGERLARDRSAPRSAS